MVDILQAALAEERALLTRLAAVRAVIAAYGSSPPSAPVSPMEENNLNRVISRQPSDRTLRICEIAKKVISNASGRPVPTRDILKVVEEEGVDVGGKVPTSTLSALLSHAVEFKANGRIGWTLAQNEIVQKTPDVDASGVLNTDGVTAPSEESQETKNLFG